MKPYSFDRKSKCCWLRQFVSIIAFVNYFDVCLSRGTHSYGFPSRGTLLNTNTIDSFKSADKKQLLEGVARKVYTCMHARLCGYVNACGALVQFGCYLHSIKGIKL